MNDGWGVARLGDSCVKIGSGATPRGGRDTYLQEGPVALIRSQNIYNDRFVVDGLAYISEAQAIFLSNVVVEPNDVLLNITGDSVARCNQVDASVLPARVNQHVAIVRTDVKKLDARFLRYYLVTPAVQQQLLQLASAGATRPALTKAMIESLLITMPIDVAEQRAIAEVLGSLDDKIELNRKMSATLEAMARALFKSWFVDFDPVRAKAEGRDPGLPPEIAALFPDSFEDSELGQIPKGWEAGPLGHFFQVGMGGAWGLDKSSARADIAVNCLRGIDCHDLAEGRIPNVPERYLSQKQLEDRDLEDGTILIEGSGSFCGRSLFWDNSYRQLLGKDVAYSNFCKRLDPIYATSQTAICWMQLRAAYQMGEIQAYRIGTAFPNFDVHGALVNLIVAVPPLPLANKYYEIFRLSRRVDLMAQSRTLAALRDALLPKLISGEIRVREADRVVEKTA